jgi:hypothetical protein
MSSALVIGARGALGSTLARCLEEEGWEVLRGSRRPEGDGASRVVDLDHADTVASAIAGVDLVINVVPHPALPAERLVLREGGALIDISARPASSVRLLREEAKDARGVVLLNVGRTPGVSNLVAADLLAAHPEADTVEIALGFSASGTSGRAGGEFVHRYLTSSGAHATAVLPFPQPLGSQRCIKFADEDAGWLGELAQGLTVDTYARFAPRVLNWALLTANAAHLMSVLPRAMFVSGKSTVPEHVTNEPVTDWAAVLRQGTRLAARTIESEGAYRSTAAATAVFASALLERTAADANLAGCFDPQELFTLEQLDDPLRRAGVRIVEQRPG